MLCVAPDVDLDGMLSVLRRDLEALPEFLPLLLDDYQVIGSNEVHSLLASLALAAIRTLSRTFNTIHERATQRHMPAQRRAVPLPAPTVRHQ
jgi:hypothetical protein